MSEQVKPAVGQVRLHQGKEVTLYDREPDGKRWTICQFGTIDRDNYTHTGVNCCWLADDVVRDETDFVRGPSPESAPGVGREAPVPGEIWTCQTCACLRGGHSPGGAAHAVNPCGKHGCACVDHRPGISPAPVETKREPVNVPSVMVNRRTNGGFTAGVEDGRGIASRLLPPARPAPFVPAVDEWDLLPDAQTGWRR